MTFRARIAALLGQDEAALSLETAAVRDELRRRLVRRVRARGWELERTVTAGAVNLRIVDPNTSAVIALAAGTSANVGEVAARLLLDAVDYDAGTDRWMPTPIDVQEPPPPTWSQLDES